LAGLALKRRLLERVAALDPEPIDLERTLMRAVEGLGPPTGPTRALALSFLEEWHAACTTPQWIAHLLDEAVRRTAEQSHAMPVEDV
jgi:hypothetical protein